MNNKNFNTLSFYQELLLGEKGTLDALGATMKVAFQLFQSKDTIDLKSNEFVDSSDLNEDCLNWVKDKGIDYINNGYQQSEKVKDKLIADYDNFKKDRPQLLRVLRDSLPVACFLIDSDSPLKFDDKYFTEPKGARALQLFINPKKFINKKGMVDKFNSNGSPMVEATFNDLQRMSSFWFFNTEKETNKTSFESANDKVKKAFENGIDKEGKLVVTKEGQRDSTLNSCVKTINDYLDLFDNENRGDLITLVIEHTQQLTWFNKNSLPQQNIINYGLVHKDSIKINQVENIKKVSVNKK